MLHVVKYGDVSAPWYGFIRPYHSVRDAETYSLTFMPPSMIDGIAKELGCKGKIVRSLLQHTGKMGLAQDKTERVFENKKGEKIYTNSIYKVHLLLNPAIYLAFENVEDADEALRHSIYIGRTEYPAYPIERIDMSVEDFEKIQGIEAIPCTEDTPGCQFMGNNRWKNNERQYAILRVV